MSEALLRADLEARDAALDPARSVLLQAPAGSGKTAVLTQRFLRLLGTVDEPEAILAITFTRKAAGEMRARVMRALRDEIEDDNPNRAQLRALAANALRHAAARGWKLLQDPRALRIQTIDSFDYWLASQLPVAARAGGAFEVTDTPEELYRHAARRTLVEGESDAQLGPDIELLFERFDNNWNLLERLLVQMLSRRGHWLRYVADNEPQVLCERVNVSLADIIGARLQATCRLVPQSLLRTAAALPGVGPLLPDPAHLAAWQRLGELALTERGWRKSLAARHLGVQYAEPAARAALGSCIELLAGVAGLESSLRELVSLPPPALSTADSAALTALSRVLARAASELQMQFAAGKVDYTWVAGAAREALSAASEPTDLALRTGLRLRHILVDEFQDTSLAQFQLLESLTAAWEPDDGRTLFVVGDPMQSIYRFRDAEVGLFLAARERGIGSVRLKPLQLTRNFRSTPALIEWTNRTFAPLFAAADELRSGAVAYRPSVAARSATAGLPAVELNLYPDSRHSEAQALARRVVELRALDRRGSIAVLVCAHAHAPPVVAALEACGIESRGVDLVPLVDRAIVRDLMQLARALHDLADRSAWLAVLRAPWCGVQLATLSALSGPDPAPLIFETSERTARTRSAPPADPLMTCSAAAAALR